MFGNNILPTSGPKEVDPITIANIQRQSQEREYEIVEDSIGNIKLKNYTSEDSALSKDNSLFQRYMAEGKKIAIKRETGIELQWRWICKDCGVEIAYQNFPHDFEYSNEITIKSKPTVRACFYIIKNALATDISYCELLEESQKLILPERK